MDYKPQEFVRDSVLVSQHSSGLPVLNVTLSDILDRLRGQLLGSLFLAIFLYAILHILKRSPKEQVGWVHAWRVVARVADLKPFGDGSVVEPPGERMGGDPVFVLGKQAVFSGGGSSTSPKPAFFGFGHLIPKALCYRRIEHMETSTFLLLGGGVRALPLLES